MRFGAAILFLGLMSQTEARAAFYTYPEWEVLPEIYRTFYVAGAFDSLVGFGTSGDVGTAMHYKTCLFRSKMTDGQLAKNVATFGSAHPELQGDTVQLVLIKYLIAMCGAPPL